MRRLLLSLFLFLLPSAAVLVAKPAYPGIIRHTQPDGSVIEIRIHGDEWGHWITDLRGRVLEEDALGFYRPAAITPEMAAKAVALRRSAMRQMAQEMRADAPIALGQKHFLVILAEFSDLPFTTANPQQAISSLMNQKGYSKGGATGSARDFYYENSHGIFEPVFDVYGPATLANGYAHYGANNAQGSDVRAHLAVREACQKLDEQIDFSKYDNDGDGYVDLVFMFYAGKGEADGGSSDTIWPHQWWLHAGGTSFRGDGTIVDRYACHNEIDNTGRLCGMGGAAHEFGHAMGLPDFYDTDYDDNGYAGGLYDFSLMCGGSYNNNSRTPPYFTMLERILLGWKDESAIQPFRQSGPVTLTSVQNDVAYRTPTDTEGEYFVYECRNSEGWDKAIGAYGLIVYHVDQSSRKVKIDGVSYKASTLWSDWQNTNAINANGSHPCYYVVPAFAQKMYYVPTNLSSDAQKLPFPGSKEVTHFTPVSWNGVNGVITFTDIAFDGSVVTMTANNVPEEPEDPAAVITYCYIANPGAGVYAPGDNFQFKLVQPKGLNVQEVAWYFDGSSMSSSSVALAPGQHRVEAELTLGDGRKDIVTLEIKVQ